MFLFTTSPAIATYPLLSVWPSCQSGEFNKVVFNFYIEIDFSFQRSKNFVSKYLIQSCLVKR